MAQPSERRRQKRVQMTSLSKIRKRTSFNVHSAGSTLPRRADDPESHRPGPVTCPFDFVILPGAIAEAAITTLRSELPDMTPVIFGNPTRATNLIETVNLAQSPDEILERATNFDLDSWFRARTIDLQRAWYAVEGAPPHGEWPTESVPTNDLCLIRDLRGSLCPEIVVGLLPCAESTAVAAHLRFGGWNACPEPAVHIALARRWATSHGATLIANISDTLEFRIARPITAQEDAMQMSMIHYLYCSETVEQLGAIEYAAASLIDSSVWQFWWD